METSAKPPEPVRAVVERTFCVDPERCPEHHRHVTRIVRLDDADGNLISSEGG